MKKLVLAITGLLFALTQASAQSYNQEQTALANFFTRMYKSNPFTGVRVVSDYKSYYLLSVVLVKKQPQNIMDRVAQVKSMRDVSQYLNNNTVVSSQSVIRMKGDEDGQQTAEIPDEIITESSVGYTQGMAVLTAFDADDNQRCYMFYKKISDISKKKKK